MGEAQMKMLVRIVALICLAVILPCRAQQQVPAIQKKLPLKLAQTIPLPGLKEGDFDHFTSDPDGHRLFLTGEENDKVLVFDTRTNKLIHTMDPAKSPHAILYRKDENKLFVVEGDDSVVRVYDSNTYKKLGEITLSIDADSIAYDPATKYVYVVNGGRAAKTPFSFISVVDTTQSKKLRDIKIDNEHVEAIVLEKAGPRLFCNITGMNAVGVMDRTQSSLQSTWPLPAGVEQNVAMALDEANHRLLLAARKPGTFVVMDSDNGKVIASLPAVGMVDDLAYDAGQKRIYLAGDQFVDVFEQKDADHYALIGHIPGGFRAKTGILIPELKRYYLAAPKHGTKTAEVRVYEVQP
jgi:DNA-binding beta-propeller fold protein YncE